MFIFFRRQAKQKRGKRRSKKTDNDGDTTETDHLKEKDHPENEHRVVAPTTKQYTKEDKYPYVDKHRSALETPPVHEQMQMQVSCQ